jgi:hypothetical protein
MIVIAILLAAIGSVFWTVRELILNTFKPASRSKSFIFGFAVTGLQSHLLWQLFLDLYFAPSCLHPVLRC